MEYGDRWDEGGALQEMFEVSPIFVDIYSGPADQRSADSVEDVIMVENGGSGVSNSLVQTQWRGYRLHILKFSNDPNSRNPTD